MANKEKRPSLPATDSGPKPGDFPVGSIESRAAARSILERHGREILFYGSPHEQPYEGPEKPIGQTLIDGELYEIYGELSHPRLYPKAGNAPLPYIKLAEDSVVVRFTDVE